MEDSSPEKEALPEEERPKSKRLRYTEPDLKIIVKYTKEEHGKEVQLQKEYHCYSQLMAHLSKFIDTSLSVEMKEKTTREIIFQGVTPELFEMALKYQEHASVGCSMTGADAVKVVKFYDQYEFSDGVQLCAKVLSDFLKMNTALDIMTPPEDLDLVVEAVRVSFDLNLPKAKDEASNYLHSRIDFGGNLDKHGATIFSVAHIKKLHPILKQDIFRDKLLTMGAEEEDISSPLFPKLFVSMAAEYFVGNACRLVTLSGSLPELDGDYQRFDRFCFEYKYSCGSWKLLDGRPCRFFVSRHDPMDEGLAADWSIMTEDKLNGSWQVMWKCPYSSYLEVPPKGPWIPVDTPKKDASPRLGYLGSDGD